MLICLIGVSKPYRYASSNQACPQSETALSERFGRLLFIRHANSFGGVESVIGRTYLGSHRKIVEADRLAMGISPTMLRVSVGLESVGDILGDLERMLWD